MDQLGGSDKVMRQMAKKNNKGPMEGGGSSRITTKRGRGNKGTRADIKLAMYVSEVNRMLHWCSKIQVGRPSTFRSREDNNHEPGRHAEEGTGTGRRERNRTERNGTERNGMERNGT